MESGLLKVLTNGCTMHACMGGMMPMDVVRFLAICREVHDLVSAAEILVAKFAVSRWYCAGGSLSIFLHGALFGIFELQNIKRILSTTTLLHLQC